MSEWQTIEPRHEAVCTLCGRREGTIGRLPLGWVEFRRTSFRVTACDDKGCQSGFFVSIEKQARSLA